MEIDIPQNLGLVEVNRLSSGKNIIFAADYHISYQAQASISFLYIHLAQEYGLTLVGFENHPERQKFAKGKPHTSRTDWEGAIRRKQVGRWAGDDSADQFSHPQIIAYSALFLGFELDLVDAGNERQLSNLDLVYDYYSQKEKEPNDEADLARDLKSAYDRLDPGLQAALTIRGGASVENIRYLRTNEHTSAVVKAMEEAEKSLALICRGDVHKLEFISVAESLGLGYLVFVPNDLFVEDPLLTMIYTNRIAAYQRLLIMNRDL